MAVFLSGNPEYDDLNDPQYEMYSHILGTESRNANSCDLEILSAYFLKKEKKSRENF